MAVTFNHPTSRIRITSPQVSLTIQDLVNASRVEEARDLTKPQIISASGKETLSQDVAVGITATLLRDWQIEWWPGNYTAIIDGGNIVAESGDPVAYVVGGPQVEITLSAAATITNSGGTGTTGPSAEEIAIAVWQRVLEGSITAEGMMRTMLAFAAGNANAPGGAGAFSFRSQDGARVRIAGAVDAIGNRTVTGVDPL